MGGWGGCGMTRSWGLTVMPSSSDTREVNMEPSCICDLGGKTEYLDVVFVERGVGNQHPGKAKDLELNLTKEDCWNELKCVFGIALLPSPMSSLPLHVLAMQQSLNEPCKSTLLVLWPRWYIAITVLGVTPSGESRYVINGTWCSGAGWAGDVQTRPHFSRPGLRQAPDVEFRYRSEIHSRSSDISNQQPQIEQWVGRLVISDDSWTSNDILALPSMLLSC